MPSPYDDIPPVGWAARTAELIESHPLDTGEIVEVVLASWDAIFESRLGGKFRIGHEIYPQPQIMGFLLHALIPLELAARHPKLWRPEQTKLDKDIVYIPDPNLSVELKTSSHPSQIFGNRSYAQEGNGTGKSKSGFYLTVNFKKFTPPEQPHITLIRFGWLDHTDWIGQAAATGQQARIRPESDRTKLIRLYASD